MRGIIKEEENPGKGNSRSSARRPGKTPCVWGTAKYRMLFVFGVKETIPSVSMSGSRELDSP